MRVAVLVLPSSRLFDIAAAAEAFSSDKRNGRPRNDLVFHAPSPRVNLSGDVDVSAAPLDGAAAADLIVIPGFSHIDDAFSDSPDDGLVQAVDVVRAARAHGTTIAALCTGAFLAARAGLLDGQIATTHWRYAALFQERFPRVCVDADRIFAHDDSGLVWTSAGVTAGIDLCVELVRARHGSAAAADVARGLVMPVVRGGGQRQYVPPRIHTAEGSSGVIVRVTEAVVSALNRPWPVADLAAVGAVSVRTLHRRFADILGVSPAAWVAAQRVEVGRELLETTSLSIDEIAQRVGFSDATLFRRHFLARFGVPPSRYRASFAARDSIDE